MVAMSGCSPHHSTLMVNLVGAIRTALRGTSCRAFNSDLRVHVSPTMYTYPDLSVVCGNAMPGDDREDILSNPTVIFEVLSPSTERYEFASIGVSLELTAIYERVDFDEC